MVKIQNVASRALETVFDLLQHMLVTERVESAAYVNVLFSETGLVITYRKLITD